MKKSVLLVIAILLLASSLALVSCAEKGGGGNAFIGTWITSEYMFDNSFYPATIKFSASDWTLSVPGVGINEKGSYRLLAGSDYVADLSQNGSSFFSASVSSGVLSVVSTIPISPYGYGGRFTKQ
jgi:hypothetical protein